MLGRLVHKTSRETLFSIPKDRTTPLPHNPLVSGKDGEIWLPDVIGPAPGSTETKQPKYRRQKTEGDRPRKISQR